MPELDSKTLYPSKNFVRYLLVVMGSKVKPNSSLSSSETIATSDLIGAARMDSCLQSGKDMWPTKDREYRKAIEFVAAFLYSGDETQADLVELGLSSETIDDLAKQQIHSSAQLQLTNEMYLLRSGLRRDSVNEVKLLLNNGFPLGQVVPVTAII